MSAADNSHKLDTVLKLLKDVDRRLKSVESDLKLLDLAQQRFGTQVTSLENELRELRARLVAQTEPLPGM